MFVYIFISYCILYTSSATDMLSNIWEEDNFHLSASLRGKELPEQENKVLVSRLSKLPFTEQVKSDVWYKLLRFRTVESLDLTDWKKYEPLIPYLPLSLLQRVNFTNDRVLTYFGQQKLSEFQLLQLAEESMLRRKNVLDNPDEIFKLGNIICGFTRKYMSTMKTSVLRSLLEKNFFQSLNSCNQKKLAYLSKLVKRFTVIGPPRTWQPENVRKAGILVAGLNPTEIREIREASFSQISAEVINNSPLEILRAMKVSQLKTLNKSALMTWRRKTQDLRGLYESQTSSGSSTEIPLVFLVPAFLSVMWRELC